VGRLEDHPEEHGLRETGREHRSVGGGAKAERGEDGYLYGRYDLVIHIALPVVRGGGLALRSNDFDVLCLDMGRAIDRKVVAKPKCDEVAAERRLPRFVKRSVSA
jgi:hypothetical protein